MANKKTLTGDLWTISLDTDGQVNLGDAAEGVASSWLLHIKAPASGSLVLRKKARRSAQFTDANAPATFYTNFATGVDVAAGTAITSDTLVKVLTDGCDLVLDYDATTGAMIVEAVPLLG